MIPDLQLFDAIQRGNLADAVEALKLGANIHAKDLENRTVLEVVSDCASNQLVSWLVKQVADPNQIVDKHGLCLLHNAVRADNLGFATALLENDAIVDAVNHAGQTPLFLAVRGGLAFMADRSIQSGAPWSIKY